jgi:ribosomal protein S6--L-glutamate ligase
LNSAAITQSRDKLYSLQLLLQRCGIPTTGFANSPLDTNDLIKGWWTTINCKVIGTQERVVLAETKSGGKCYQCFQSLNANILVQEFIKEANGKDLRLFVIDGKVVATIQREAMQENLEPIFT